MSAATASFWQMVYGSEATHPTSSAEVTAVLPTPSNADLSINRPNDKYDDLGRNVSAQKRRQEAEPWVVVSNKRAKSDQEEKDEEDREHHPYNPTSEWY